MVCKDLTGFLKMRLVFGIMVFLSFSEGLIASPVSGYTLGSGDVISIRVYGEPDLSLEAQLSDVGSISYPFLGELSFSGKTASELETIITKGLKGDYLVDPKVTVSIRKYRNFYINGEVKRPGGLQFEPGLTIRKAVSLAGGFTERAAKRNIFVISDNDPGHKPKRVGLNETIMPGDIITVEESFF